MGWNGSGTVTLVYDWSARRDAGNPTNIIGADEMDDQFIDIASAIEATLNRNGENAITADISWGSNRITSLADPTAATDAINASSVAENTVQYGGTTGGTVNAQTVTNPFITTVGTGTRILCLAGATNTGATTLSVNGQSPAVAVVRPDGSSALVGGEIRAGDFFEVVYDGTSYVLIHSPQTETGNFTDGSITVGVEDDTPGNISLYGGGTGETSGYVRIFNDFDNQGETDFWQFACYGGDLTLVDDAGAAWLRAVDTGGLLLDPAGGIISVGANTSVPALASLYGGGAGVAGADLRIYRGNGGSAYTRLYHASADDVFRIARSGGSAADIAIGTNGNVGLSQDSGVATVGIEDTTSGNLFLYGGSGGTGGELRIYNGATAGTPTTDYFIIDGHTAGQLRIIRNVSGIADFSLSEDGDLSLAQSTGVIGIGQSVTTNADMFFHGGAAGESGAILRIYRGNGSTAFTQLYHAAGDDTFRLLRSNGSASDLSVTSAGAVTIAADGGTVNVGQNDSVRGYLRLNGGGTGELGAEIQLYNAVDDQSTAEYWGLECEDGTGDFAITQAGTTRFSITNGGGVTATSLSLTTDLAVEHGGTGASTESAARSNLGLAIGSDVQAYDADLSAIAALAKTNGNFIVGNGSTWVAESGATARTSLGLGSLATLSTINDGNWSGTDLAVANGGTGASTQIDARANLGLTIGTNVQAYDADLSAIAALAKTDGNFIVGNGSTWIAESGATARTSLGLGSLATLSTVNNSNWSGTDLAITNGGTGASSAADAATNFGLGVGNSPTFTGVTLSGLSGGMVVSSSSGVLSAGWTASGSNPNTSTSGQFMTFTGIPSWATNVVLIGTGISKAAGTDTQLRIRIGPSGGVDSSGYQSAAISSASVDISTAGFTLTGGTASIAASDTCWLRAHLTRTTGTNGWHCATHLFVGGKTNHVQFGYLSASGTVDRIQANWVSGDDFDAGTWYLFYY